MNEATHHNNKIIAHFKKHKWKYIAIACLVSGVTIGYFMKTRPSITNIIDSKIINTIDSPNAITTILDRRGHPGYNIRCKETGEVFASQNRCADLLNISSTLLSMHLNGKTDHVKGLHFERLGEAK